MKFRNNYNPTLLEISFASVPAQTNDILEMCFSSFDRSATSAMVLFCRGLHIFDQISVAIFLQHVY